MEHRYIFMNAICNIRQDNWHKAVRQCHSNFVPYTVSAVMLIIIFSSIVHFDIYSDEKVVLSYDASIFFFYTDRPYLGQSPFFYSFQNYALVEKSCPYLGIYKF